MDTRNDWNFIIQATKTRQRKEKTYIEELTILRKWFSYGAEDERHALVNASRMN
jgi:hypothetical protein